MSDILYKDKFRKPEIFLSELLKSSATGQSKAPFIRRAAVVAVDVIGGRLENPTGTGKTTHKIGNRDVDVVANVGPENPPNSIKARIITDGLDQFFDDDDLRVFWPFMTEHVSVPIKPGEHVYVLFEDEGMEHGLWMSKVSGHNNVNILRGETTFGSSAQGRLMKSFADSSSVIPAEQSDDDRSAGERRSNDGRLMKLF